MVDRGGATSGRKGKPGAPKDTLLSIFIIHPSFKFPPSSTIIKPRSLSQLLLPLPRRQKIIPGHNTPASLLLKINPRLPGKKTIVSRDGAPEVGASRRRRDENLETGKPFSCLTQSFLFLPFVASSRRCVRSV